MSIQLKIIFFLSVWNQREKLLWDFCQKQLTPGGLNCFEERKFKKKKRRSRAQGKQAVTSQHSQRSTLQKKNTPWRHVLQQNDTWRPADSCLGAPCKDVYWNAYWWNLYVLVGSVTRRGLSAHPSVCVHGRITPRNKIRPCACKTNSSVLQNVSSASTPLCKRPLSSTLQADLSPVDSHRPVSLSRWEPRSPVILGFIGPEPGLPGSRLSDVILELAKHSCDATRRYKKKTKLCSRGNTVKSERACQSTLRINKRSFRHSRWI